MADGRRRGALLAGAIALLLAAWWIVGTPPAAETTDPPRSSRPEAPPSASPPPTSRPQGAEPAPRAARATGTVRRPRPFDGTVHTLDNGLTVILVPDHTAATIAAEVVVRVGSIDDPPELPGASHLLEHLMFHGTDRLGTLDWEAEEPHIDRLRWLYDAYAAEVDDDVRDALSDEIVAEHRAADAFAVPGDLQRLFAEIGARRTNASTSYDTTRYYTLIPANRLEAWTRIEAERFAAPVMRGLGVERAVVGSEIRLRQGDDLPWELGGLLDGHPYGAPVGGTVPAIGDARMTTLEAHWARYYVPGNAAVVLVGAFDREEALGLVDAAFGALPAEPVPERVEVPPVPSRSVWRFADSSITMSWSMGPLSVREEAALRVALGWLDWDLEQRLVGQALSFQRFAAGAIVTLKFYSRDDTAAATVTDRMRTLAGTPPAAGVLAGARWAAEVARLESLEDQPTQSREVATAWARGEDLSEATLRLLAMGDVQPEDVQAALRRLLETSPSPARAWTSEPRGDPRSTGRGRVDASARSAFHEAIAALPVLDVPPGWRVPGVHYSVADGVVAVPNPVNHLFQLTLRYPVGFREDPLICEAMDRWHAASRAKRYGAWAAPLWRLGSTVRAGCAEDATTITLRGPGATLEESVAVVLGALRDPARLGESRRLDWRDSELRTFAPFVRYGERSPYRIAFLGDAALFAATEGVLIGRLRALATIRPEVAYVGGLDASGVARLVAGTPAGRPLAEVPDDLGTTTIFVGSTCGSALTVERWSEPYDPAREGTYAVAEALWVGQAGRVTRALREVSGAYAVSVQYVRGDRVGEPNRLSLYARPRDSAVVPTIASVLETLSDPAFTAEEWASASETAATRAWSDIVPFRQAPTHLLDQLWRGLEGEAGEWAWASLPTAREFRAFTEAEAARPIRVGVCDSDPTGLAAALDALAPVRVVDTAETLP